MNPLAKDKPITQVIASSNPINRDTRVEKKAGVEPLIKPLFPKFEKFARTVNGYVDGENEDPSKHNFLCLRDIAKSAWFMYLPFQVAGLFSEKMNKLARAWYGVGWSIVYSCYRPWKANVKELTEKDPSKPISDFTKNLHKTNEGFRIGMGSAVSAIYGGGALGMLWGVLTGNDDLFDKSANTYKTGMFNQDQIFSSMNFSTVLQRKLYKDGLLHENHLDEIDKKDDNIKSKVELVDSVLFIPTIITRALDTAKQFLGVSLGEGAERITNALAYFKYGTWATKFGVMKAGDKDEGGDLEMLKDSNKFLHDTQKYSAKAFCYTLPALSWVASACELFGAREMAEKVFNFEGILERLNPTIASWCLTNPWLQGYLKAMPHPEAKLSTTTQV